MMDIYKPVLKHIVLPLWAKWERSPYIKHLKYMKKSQYFSREKIREIQKQGTTILMVEQDASIALNLADRAYLLEDGSIERSGPCDDFLMDDYIIESYLGFT